MVYGNHPQPATNMHNHHDLFTWLMKYAPVKSNLLLLSPPAPHFHLFPHLPLSLNLFCLVQPLCLTKYLSSSLQWPKMFGKCTNKKYTHTLSAGCILKACTHTDAHTRTHIFISVIACMRDAENSSIWRGIWNEMLRKIVRQNKGRCIIVLSCRERLD